MYFAPDVPKEIDLSEFNQKQRDFYPFSIKDKLTFKQDYKEL